MLIGLSQCAREADAPKKTQNVEAVVTRIFGPRSGVKKRWNHEYKDKCMLKVMLPGVVNTFVSLEKLHQKQVKKNLMRTNE